MSATPETAETTALAPRRPLRADARENYDKLIAAAREVFAEEGSGASLEEIARRAQVGIATLYRRFPTRQDLLEATYLEEVEAISNSAADFEGLSPWDALAGWLRRYVAFAATKRALAEELLAYIDRDSEMFQSCGAAITAAGEPLLERAQQAGVVRADTTFGDVARMVSGIAAIRASDPEQIDRILDVALDGLRYRPSA
jgi:AcrR family transcriptional regulator